MINVCQKCGQYRADKIADPAQAYTVCPECNYKQRFRYLPIFFVSGPSGVGKSTICQALTGVFESAIVLDGDILWRPEFNSPETQYRDFFETWLRMAKNIAQAGRPVVLFGAGCIPSNIEPCVESRYFSQAHYLALTCNSSELRERLQQRPEWRQSGSEEFINGNISFNEFLVQLASETEAVTSCDTTNRPLAETVAEVEAWIVARLL